MTSDDLFPREDVDDAAGARSGKSDAAFRTISEVADDLNVPQHVLRFWETKFTQVRPLKRGGGRRYYRPEDIVLLRRIRELLYTDGMTIRGVQKLLREAGGKAVSAEAEAATPDETAGPPAPPVEDNLRRILSELTVLRDELRAALR